MANASRYASPLAAARERTLAKETGIAPDATRKSLARYVTAADPLRPPLQRDIDLCIICLAVLSFLISCLCVVLTCKRLFPDGVALEQLALAEGANVARLKTQPRSVIGSVDEQTKNTSTSTLEGQLLVNQREARQVEESLRKLELLQSDRVASSIKETQTTK